MAEVTYTSVTWTTGDTITEAKLDSMVANDRAVDAMNNGIEFAERANPSTPSSNKVHAYAKDKGGTSSIYVINDAGTVYELSEGRPTFYFPITGTLTTGTTQLPPLAAHRTLTIVKAFAVVDTAPTDATLIIDINKNGSTIMTGTKLQITTGNTTGSQTTFSTTTLADEDLLTIDIDQVGSSVAGADLTVYLRCK